MVGVVTAATATRAVWWWCLVYTLPAAPTDRRRRREELRNHLWESREVGQRGRAVMGAALRGMVADLGWAAGSMLAGLGRLGVTPMTWVAIAMVFPVMGWWSDVLARLAWSSQGIVAVASFGGPVSLAVAAALAFRARRRRDR